MTWYFPVRWANCFMQMSNSEYTVWGIASKELDYSPNLPLCGKCLSLKLKSTAFSLGSKLHWVNFCDNFIFSFHSSLASEAFDLSQAVAYICTPSYSSLRQKGCWNRGFEASLGKTMRLHLKNKLKIALQLITRHCFRNSLSLMPSTSYSGPFALFCPVYHHPYPPLHLMDLLRTPRCPCPDLWILVYLLLTSPTGQLVSSRL